MISIAYSMPAGDSAHIVIHPPPGALKWRLLRRSDMSPQAWDDPAAILVHEGGDLGPLDAEVRNGQTWFYEVWHWDGAEWKAGGYPVVLTIASKYGSTPDPILLVRERLWLGLVEFVRRGALRPRRKDGTPSNEVPVSLAPPLFEETPFPVVTVQLLHSAPEERGIGDDLMFEEPTGIGMWECGTGWIERTTYRITAWSLNVDERNTLRHIVKTILAANMPVFYEAGLDRIDLNASHEEDLTTYNVPIYRAVIDLSASVAFAAKWGDDWAIEDVDVTARSY